VLGRRAHSISPRHCSVTSRERCGLASGLVVRADVTVTFRGQNRGQKVVDRMPNLQKHLIKGGSNSITKVRSRYLPYLPSSYRRYTARRGLRSKTWGLDSGLDP
jgi:hypothetical protein